MRKTTIITLAIATLLLAVTSLLTTSRPSMPIETLNIHHHPLLVEIAATPDHRMVGLSNRSSLPDNTGMLFIFDEPGNHTFWMKNTYIPLSIAFIDTSGRVVDIQDMQPNSPEYHTPPLPIQYALEVKQGWFADKLRVGDVLTLP